MMQTATTRCVTCGANLEPVPLIVGLDLDLTTLGKDDHIAPRTTRGISNAFGSGVQIVIATGKPMHDTLIWKQVLGVPWAIAMNGAAVAAPGGRAIRLAPPLPETFLTSVRRVAADHDDDGISLHFHTLNGWYPAKRRGEATEEYARRHDRTPAPGLWARNTVLMIEVTGPASSLDAFAKELPELDRYSVTRSSDFASEYLDIGPAGIGKDRGLDHVLTAHGAKWDQVAAIGDGLNDRCLFERARVSVAVSGAVPELEEVATHKIDRDAEHGAVGVVLEAIVQNNGTARRELICLHRGRQ